MGFLSSQELAERWVWMQDRNAVDHRWIVWLLLSRGCPPQGLCRVLEATPCPILCCRGGDKEPGGILSRIADPDWTEGYSRAQDVLLSLTTGEAGQERLIPGGIDWASGRGC